MFELRLPCPSEPIWSQLSITQYPLFAWKKPPIADRLTRLIRGAIFSRSWLDFRREGCKKRSPLDVANALKPGFPGKEPGVKSCGRSGRTGVTARDSGKVDVNEAHMLMRISLLLKFWAVFDDVSRCCLLKAFGFFRYKEASSDESFG